MAKRPAASSSKRLGSLIINPGGPGGSGVGYVGYFNAAGLESYDIVGWDPRGVGRSTPVSCFGREDLDRYFSMDSSPDDPGELQARIDAQIEFGQSCLDRSGALEHISTMDTVRDLDLLRYLLGDSKINYFGSSYGTRIGALYAELFPAASGSDGSMAQSTSIPSPRSIKWTALSGRSAISLRGVRMNTAGSVPSVMRCCPRSRISLIASTSSRWRWTAGGPSASSRASRRSSTPYGGRGGWPSCGMRSPPQSSMGMAPGCWRWPTPRIDAIAMAPMGSSICVPAIRCLDSQDDSVRAAEKRLAEESRRAPILGRLNGPDLTCPLWPVKSAPKQPAVDGNGAPAIVVIGTTGDPATPYEYAKSMADQLSSAVLVTFNGEGHLAYGQSSCVKSVVDAYLVRSQVPRDGTRC